MRQTGYLPRPPTSTYPPEILHAGSCPGSICELGQHTQRSRHASRLVLRYMNSRLILTFLVLGQARGSGHFEGERLETPFTMLKS